MAKNGSGISKVLIAYDGSGFAHGVLSELRLSGLPQKAHAVIISVCEIWLPPVNPLPEVPFGRELAEYFQKHGEQVDRNMAEASMIAGHAREELLRYFPDWSIEIDVVSGSPAREILLKAAEFQPDLIVVGERGLSSNQAVGLGSTAQAVLSNAKCSVRISRIKLDARSHQRIIIGFDGSPGSMSAVKMVASRAWTTMPQIRLVTITDPFTLLNPGRVFDPIAGMSEGTMEEKKNGSIYLQWVLCSIYANLVFRLPYFLIPGILVWS